MIFEAVEKHLAIANKAFDISRHKAQAFVECAAMDAAIQMEESEFKIFQESGDDDTLIAMYEEATEGLLAKVKRGISAVVEGLKKFFSALKDKIISIFKKKEVEESIKEIGLKAKLPFFKTQKVEIKDTEAELKVLDKFKAKYQSLISKVKSGGAVDEGEITETRESFLKEHAVAAGAVVSVTIAAAIGLLLKYHKSLDNDVSEAENDVTKELEKLEGSIGETLGSDKINDLIKLANGQADIAKAKGNAIVTAVSGLIAKIKAKVLKKTDVNDDGGKVEESAVENDTLLNSSEFSFMQESGEKSETENEETQYNSDWIKTIFPD